MLALNISPQKNAGNNAAVLGNALPFTTKIQLPQSVPSVDADIDYDYSGWSIHQFGSSHINGFFPVINDTDLIQTATYGVSRTIQVDRDSTGQADSVNTRMISPVPVQTGKVLKGGFLRNLRMSNAGDGTFTVKIGFLNQDGTRREFGTYTFNSTAGLEYRYFSITGSDLTANANDHLFVEIEVVSDTTGLSSIIYFNNGAGEALMDFYLQ